MQQPACHERQEGFISEGIEWRKKDSTETISLFSESLLGSISTITNLFTLWGE